VVRSAVAELIQRLKKADYAVVAVSLTRISVSLHPAESDRLQNSRLWIDFEGGLACELAQLIRRA
jgi:hypothetical protein